MRLDILITEKKLTKSRNVATDLIKKGLVKVSGEIVSKPAKDFSDTVDIEILEQPKYVGRGGLKLEKALEEFQIDPRGLIILDVGSSTGGFTDCLLQRGARKVYAVDVGTGQLDQTLKNDQRVVSMEQTDIRNIETLADKIDLAVIDVSFISLELILQNVSDLLSNTGKIIALVKPQFETQKSDKNKKGIVKNNTLRTDVIENIKKFARQINLAPLNVITSPILGGSGNIEFLVLLQK